MQKREGERKNSTEDAQRTASNNKARKNRVVSMVSDNTGWA